MKYIHTLAIVTAFTLTTVTSGWAFLGFPDKVEGTVKNISSNVITISKESKNGNAVLEDLAFEINEKTKLKDVNSLTELQEGDTVKIGYKEEGTRKIAVSVDRQEAKADLTTIPEATQSYSDVDASGASDGGSQLQEDTQINDSSTERNLQGTLGTTTSGS